MTEKHFIIATAGHVDHGKSALVKALTGTDPDRLPEEKARGITIDLGFANLRLTNGDAMFNIGIVDVPGHEDFVKNMVAGVGAIDVALFVVAADDGWMPQTEEHLQILSYLGIQRAVVALTKSDLCSDIERATQQIRERLVGSPFSSAEIVATSIVAGTGMEELKTSLAHVLSTTEPARDIGKPRLPVDRVFTLKGIGTVVTGTLMGGKLARGQAVVAQPRGTTARIRSIQSHSSEIETAQPGSRTALNIPDLQVRGTVCRGDVITFVDLGKPTSLINVVLHKSARVTSEKISSLARPLKTGLRVRVHHGTRDVTAAVFLLDQKELRAGETALAQLRLEANTFVFIGDRFIIRDWSEQATLAGGTVLEVHCDARHYRAESNRVFLKKTAEQITNAAAIVEALLERDQFCRVADVLTQSNISREQIAAAISQLVAEKKAHRAGEWLADPVYWSKLRSDAAAIIDAAHKARPDAPGVLLSDLRSTLENSHPFPADVFNVLIAELGQNGFVQSAEKIRRASHQLTLPPQLQAAGAKLRAALAAKPLDPPSRKELAPDALSQQALRFLINSGEAVELNAEIALSSRAFKQALDVVRNTLASKKSATVSDIRQVLGTSRRVVVPLLEKLDRDGVTRRVGDLRSLR